MDVESYRAYCLSKPGVTESFPFDNNTLVFKVLNRMFSLVSLEKNPVTVNLKCDPERALELRANFDGLILPGFHMNKQQWNTVSIERIPPELVLELTDHSYALVVEKLPKKVRDQL